MLATWNIFENCVVYWEQGFLVRSDEEFIRRVGAIWQDPYAHRFEHLD